MPKRPRATIDSPAASNSYATRISARGRGRPAVTFSSSAGSASTSTSSTRSLRGFRRRRAATTSMSCESACGGKRPMSPSASDTRRRGSPIRSRTEWSESCSAGDVPASRQREQREIKEDRRRPGAGSVIAMTGRVEQRRPRAYFFVSAAGLSVLAVFAFGVAVGAFKLFPYPLLERGAAAARDWIRYPWHNARLRPEKFLAPKRAAASALAAPVLDLPGAFDGVT